MSRRVSPPAQAVAELQNPSPGQDFTLTLLLFGGFEVRCQGKSLPKMRSRKELWLLALLILNARERPVSRSWLAGTLWPNAIERDALFSLRRSLSLLRDALGPEADRISSPAPRSLQIDLSGATCDVAAFDAAILLSKDDAQEEAVRLYRGSLLPGCHEDWAIPERERREQEAISALEALAGKARLRGDHACAEQRLRRALEFDPLRETSVRALMEALSAQANPAEAREVYRSFRARVRRALNSEPDPETILLNRSIGEQVRQRSLAMAEIAESASSRPYYIPAARSRLIGRATDWHGIVEQLQFARLVTVIGPGGVGKTRMAIEIASTRHGECLDGACFVDLTPIRDGGLLPRAVLAALGVPEKPGTNAAESLTAFLKSKRMLLVLDNCEQITTECARLAESLLDACPGIRILATSRESLRVYGEVSYSLSGLPLETAVMLFADAASRGSEGLRISSADSLSVERICARLDGLPLAIEMAAARTRAVPVAEIAARLGESFQLLGTVSDTGRAPRHRTLRATFDWSYELLTERERLLLTALSVFVGGWTLEAAEELCVELEQVDADDVLDLLASLVDKSLIVFSEDRFVSGRYRLLETIREYGQEKLHLTGLETRLRQRHAASLLRFADASEKPMMGPDQVQWRRLLAADIDNFRAALTWYESEADAGSNGLLGVRLTRALVRFWFYGGQFAEAREWSRKALRYSAGRLAGDDLVWRTKLLADAGALAQRQGDPAEAQALTEESLEIFRANGDSLNIARCVSNLGIAAQMQGDFPRALSYFEDALAYWKTTGDEGEIATALANLANRLYLMGDFDLARTYTEESLSLRRKIGDPQRIAVSLHNLGTFDQVQGKYDTARIHHEEALVLRRQCLDQVGVAASLGNLGEVLGALGDRQSWKAMATEALGIRRQINERLGIALSTHDLGDIAYREGDYDQARSLLHESLTLRRELNERRGFVLCFLLIATVTLADSDDADTRVVDAARLYGACDTLLAELGPVMSFKQQAEQAKLLLGLQDRLGEAAVLAAREHGRTLTTAEAIDLAMTL